MALSFSSTAKSGWTLEECIAYAKANNTEIRSHRLAGEESMNLRNEAIASFIPQIRISAGHNFSWGRSVDMQELVIVRNKLTQASSFTAEAGVVLFDGGRKINTLKSSKYRIELSAAELKRAENDITVAVIKAFLQYLLSKQIAADLEQNHTTVLEELENTGKMVESGAWQYGKLLEIGARAADERMQIAAARGEVQTSLLELCQLMGISPDEFEIAEPQSDIIQMLPSELELKGLMESVSAMPRVIGAEAALRKSRADLSAAIGEMMPTITLTGAIGTYWSDASEMKFKNQLKENWNPSVGFTLSIPVIQSLNGSTAYRNGRIAVRQKELDLVEAKRECTREIQKTIVEASNSRSEYLAAEENMNANEDAFRMSEIKYDNGLISATDYVIARNSFQQARSQYLQKKYQYLFRLQILYFYMNLPIRI